MTYSRQTKRRSKRLTYVKQALSLLAVGLMSLLSVKFFGDSLKPKVAIADTQTTKTEQVAAPKVEAKVVEKEETTPSSSTPAASTTPETQAVTETAPVAETVTVAQVAAPQAYVSSTGAQPLVLANGNTAGAIGTAAAARMAAATGVPQATWEYIIARESNGDPTVANPSGASGLFQTMPGWGSTATVEDQINAALNAYNNQGLAAWSMQ